MVIDSNLKKFFANKRYYLAALAVLLVIAGAIALALGPIANAAFLGIAVSTLLVGIILALTNMIFFYKNFGGNNLQTTANPTTDKPAFDDSRLYTTKSPTPRQYQVAHIKDEDRNLITIDGRARGLSFFEPVDGSDNDSDDEIAEGSSFEYNGRLFKTKEELRSAVEAEGHRLDRPRSDRLVW